MVCRPDVSKRVILCPTICSALLLQERELDTLLTRIRKDDIEQHKVAEDEKEWEKSHPVSSGLMVEPNSHRYEMWMIAMVCLVTVSLILVPIDVAFSLSTRGVAVFVVQCAIDVCFLADLGLGFRTALVDQRNFYTIKRPNVIALTYLRGWFWLDLISALPIDLIMLAFGSPQASSARSQPRYRLFCPA